MARGAAPHAGCRDRDRGRCDGPSGRPPRAGSAAPAERAWIERIEARRAELAASEVSQFAQWASIAPVWGRLLMRTVRELQPRTCLELGAGFGISAAYQGAALKA